MVRPQALDEDVVSPGAFPIHADLDLILEQQAGEGDAGELGALIGVEDLRLAITYIPMARGFVYLAAVVDWFRPCGTDRPYHNCTTIATRRVVEWLVWVNLRRRTTSAVRPLLSSS